VLMDYLGVNDFGKALDFCASEEKLELGFEWHCF